MDDSDEPLDRSLAGCALEIERYVARAGWNQPPRLFSLVTTRRLMDAEPHLVDHLADVDLDGLSFIEGEQLPDVASLDQVLAGLAWPAEVDGAALAIERGLPTGPLERDPGSAVRTSEPGPAGSQLRLVVAVLRDGRSSFALRQLAHDDDELVAVDRNIAPGLARALAATLLAY